LVEVIEGVGVCVCVAVILGVIDGVIDGVILGVIDGVIEGVGVGVGVLVGVLVGVCEGAVGSGNNMGGTNPPKLNNSSPFILYGSNFLYFAITQYFFCLYYQIIHIHITRGFTKINISCIN
jgi:hypothetical protein